MRCDIKEENDGKKSSALSDMASYTKPEKEFLRVHTQPDFSYFISRA